MKHNIIDVARGHLSNNAAHDRTASRVPAVPRSPAQRLVLGLVPALVIGIGAFASACASHAAAQENTVKAPNARGGGPMGTTGQSQASEAGEAMQGVHAPAVISPEQNAQTGTYGAMPNAPLVGSTAAAAAATVTATNGVDLSQYLSDPAAPSAPQRFEIAGLNFPTGSSKLTPDGRKAVDRLALVLAQHPNAKVLVQGHTDTVGDPSNNVILSGERAATIRASLIRRGVDGNRITISGHAESAPVSSNDTEQGRARNRRADVIVMQR